MGLLDCSRGCATGSRKGKWSLLFAMPTPHMPSPGNPASVCPTPSPALAGRKRPLKTSKRHLPKTWGWGGGALVTFFIRKCQGNHLNGSAHGCRGKTFGGYLQEGGPALCLAVTGRNRV